MSPRKRWPPGTVFSLPLDEERVGYGEVAWTSRYAHCFAIFAEAYPRHQQVPVERVVGGRLAFLGRSTDALLLHGRWQVVGHREIDATTYPLPAYKAELAPGVFEVSDFMDTQRRRATAEEAEKLPPRSSRSPIGFEHLLRALHGLEEWRARDERFRPVPEHLTSAALFPSALLSPADPAEDPGEDEHGVTTHLPLSGGDWGDEDERASLHELEARLEEAAEAIGAEHGGHELGGGEAVLFSTGPDADALLEVIRSSLEGFPVPAGAYAVKEYGTIGDPDYREERVPLP